MESTQKRVDKLFNKSMIHWDNWDKISYLNYCMGVLKANINEIQIGLMEKEFKYYQDKSFKKELEQHLNFAIKHSNMDEEYALYLLENLDEGRKWLNSGDL